MFNWLEENICDTCEVHRIRVRRPQRSSAGTRPRSPPCASAAALVLQWQGCAIAAGRVAQVSGTTAARPPSASPLTPGPGGALAVYARENANRKVTLDCGPITIIRFYANQSSASAVDPVGLKSGAWN